MPDLLTLSNEVLYEIIAAVSPGDLEAFAASCPTISLLSATTVERHRQLLKQYATIKFGEWSAIQGEHPLYVLRDVLKDSRIAQYPKVMRIGDWMDEDVWMTGDDDEVIEERQLERDNVREEADSIKDLITAIITKCRFIGERETDGWVERLLDGQQHEAIAILLTLLPNLEMIQTEGPMSDVFYDMATQVATAFNCPNRPKPQALAKLSKVQISPCADDDMMSDGIHEGAGVIAPFAALPSVRTISASRLRSGGHYDGTFEWPCGMGSSNVTELDLDRSMVIDTGISNLLSGIKSLERFTYSLGGYLVDYHTYQPRSTIAALGRYAAHSLKYLHITGCWIGMRTDEDHQIDCDLKVFSQLKELRVDYTLFNDILKACPSTCNQEFRDCLCHPQRLIDRLPPSIKKVKLEGKMSLEVSRAILSGLRELGKERLPNLRSLEIEGPAASKRYNISACKAVGVVLSKGKERRRYE